MVRNLSIFYILMIGIKNSCKRFLSGFYIFFWRCKLEKYKFNLVKAYSLYSNAVIVKQDGSKICFLLSYYYSKNIKKNLRNAFSKYLDYVRMQEDCPDNFKDKPDVRFIYGNIKTIKEKIMEKGD